MCLYREIQMYSVTTTIVCHLLCTTIVWLLDNSSSQKERTLVLEEESMPSSRSKRLEQPNNRQVHRAQPQNLIQENTQY
jgi:hypothetical protein